MSRYYVNMSAQSNGDHEVHVTTCSFLPREENRLYLGEFDSCTPAVREAKKYYLRSNGCYYCCNACNTG